MPAASRRIHVSNGVFDTAVEVVDVQVAIQNLRLGLLVRENPRGSSHSQARGSSTQKTTSCHRINHRTLPAGFSKQPDENSRGCVVPCIVRNASSRRYFLANAVFEFATVLSTTRGCLPTCLSEYQSPITDDNQTKNQTPPRDPTYV